MIRVLRKKSVEETREMAEEKEFALKRELNARQLMLYVIGATIGAGIFVLPGTVAAKDAGPGVMISYLLGGIVAIAVGLAYVEFASIVPVAGSAYTYSYVALGEIFAWIIGWDLIFEFTVVAGTVAVGWSGYVTSFLESVGVVLPPALSRDITSGGVVNLPAVVGVGIVFLIAYSGIRNVGRWNEGLTWVKLGAVLLFLVVAVGHLNPANWRPFAPFGWHGVLTGAALTFFAYTGFDGVTTVLEEVKNPQRAIPVALAGGVTLVAVLYFAVAAFLTGVVPYTRLNVPDPTAFAFQQMGIRWGQAVVSVAVIFGLLATMLANGTSASRILFAMGRDGLLPERIARVHPRTHVPSLATALVFGTAMVLGGFLNIHELAELANIGGLTAFFLTTLSVMLLRKTQPELPRTFRVPALWLVGPVGLVGSLALIASLPALTFARFVLWLAVGLLVYFTYGMRHARIAARPVEAGPDPGRSRA